MTKLAELAAKVDAFFARVEARHGDDMQCATGCSDCCHARLTVTGVEAAAIRAELATWDAPRRAALAANAAAAPADHCGALSPEGRCLIYAARPLVCRSHGAPIRLGAGSLPVLPACGKNFLRTTPAADCVLDQGTVSTILLTVDRMAGGDGSRIDLLTLLETE